MSKNRNYSEAILSLRIYTELWATGPKTIHSLEGLLGLTYEQIEVVLVAMYIDDMVTVESNDEEGCLVWALTPEEKNNYL